MSPDSNPRFIPPVPSWGDGPEPALSGSVLKCVVFPMSEAMPLVFWEAMCELVDDRKQASGVTDLFVIDNSTDRAKSKSSEYSIPLDPAAIAQWVQEVPENAYARVPDESWDFFVVPARGPLGDLLSVTVRFANPPIEQHDVAKQTACLVNIADVSDQLVGYVGLGAGWARPDQFPTGTSVYGYGPAVIANRDDIRLEHVDEAAISITGLPGDRLLLEVPATVDRVAGISQVRNAVWGSFGVQFAPVSVDAGMVFFEGSPQRPNLADPMNDHVKKSLRQVAAGDIENPIVGPQRRRISSKDDAELTANSVQQLRNLVQAWRRIATAWAPEPIPDLAGAELTMTDSGVELRHGTTSRVLVEAMDCVLGMWHSVFQLQPLTMTNWTAD